MFVIETTEHYLKSIILHSYEAIKIVQCLGEHLKKKSHMGFPTLKIPKWNCYVVTVLTDAVREHSGSVFLNLYFKSLLFTSFLSLWLLDDLNSSVLTLVSVLFQTASLVVSFPCLKPLTLLTWLESELWFNKDLLRLQPSYPCSPVRSLRCKSKTPHGSPQVSSEPRLPEEALGALATEILPFAYLNSIPMLPPGSPP